MVSTLTEGPTVVLPPKNVRWVLDQPSHVLSFLAFQRHRLQLDYIRSDFNIMFRPIYLPLVVKILTRKGSSVVAETYDELQQACDHELGLDTDQWKSVCLYDSVQHLVGASTSRMMIGPPLCKNRSISSELCHETHHPHRPKQELSYCGCSLCSSCLPNCSIGATIPIICSTCSWMGLRDTSSLPLPPNSKIYRSYHQATPRQH